MMEGRTRSGKVRAAERLLEALGYRRTEEF